MSYGTPLPALHVCLTVNIYPIKLSWLPHSMTALHCPAAAPNRFASCSAVSFSVWVCLQLGTHSAFVQTYCVGTRYTEEWRHW